MTSQQKNSLFTLIPVMLCFFAMGFVDVVGTATNYVAKDLNLSESQTGFLPSLVFFWFLIFSVPTGMLMNKIGRRKTVLVSLVITAVSVLLPIFNNSFPVMVTSFCLLGIGNAFMQTSLNPLVQNLVRGDKLASTLTFGQFVKAIASFSAPYIAMWGAAAVMPHFGLEWRVIFPIFFVIAVLAIVALGATSIEEEKVEKPSTFAECLGLLKNPFVLLCFIGIVCHVGIDVGTNTYAPKILAERLGVAATECAYATGIYFLFRTIGCFLGSFILQHMSPRTFFGISVTMIALGLVGMFIPMGEWGMWVCIALIGFGNSNVFGIIFSQALLDMPAKGNEVSSLMIMGLVGGAIFPPIMGAAAGAMGQIGAVAVILLGAAYFLFYTLKIKATK